MNAICDLICGGLKPIVTNCKRTKVGGINSFVFMRKKFIYGDTALNLCSQPVSNMCNLSEWVEAVQSCRVRMTLPLKASKPEASPNERRSPYVCRTESVSFAKKEILFSDFNYSDSYLDVDFWNQIFKFPKYFKFAYLTCAGELFGWYDYSIFVSNVYDDSVIGSSMRSGKISYLDTYLEKPLLIANGVIELLKEYVNYDCATDLFINDFPLVCP